MADRGSDFILDRCPRVIQQETLERLAEVIKGSDARLVHWWCKGQPNPDVVSGTLQIDKQRGIAELLDRILDIDDLIVDVEVFPKGIPVPEFWEMRFATPGAH